MHAARELTESLRAAGLPLRRFKTGTPARVHRRSIDFSRLERQPGDPDSELQPFSFLTDAPMHNRMDCFIAARIAHRISHRHTFRELCSKICSFNGERRMGDDR